MKKIILSALVLVFLSLPFFLTYSAADIGDYVSIPTTGSVPGILDSAMRIADWLFSILLVVGVIGVVIAGYLFVSSAGDAGKIKTARDTVIYSLVGVFVAALGIVLVNWARNLFPN